MVVLAEATGSAAFPQVATLVDRAVAHRSIQVVTGGVIKHTAKRTRQTVHVDRLLLCKTPLPAAPEVDSGVLPDSETATDELTTPDEGTQPLPESQFQSQSASGSGRPIRTRRRPTALDAYILE